VGNFLLV